MVLLIWANTCFLMFLYTMPGTTTGLTISSCDRIKILQNIPPPTQTKTLHPANDIIENNLCWVIGSRQAAHSLNDRVQWRCVDDSVCHWRRGQCDSQRSPHGIDILTLDLLPLGIYPLPKTIFHPLSCTFWTNYKREQMAMLNVNVRGMFSGGLRLSLSPTVSKYLPLPQPDPTDLPPFQWHLRGLSPLLSVWPWPCPSLENLRQISRSFPGVFKVSWQSYNLLESKFRLANIAIFSFHLQGKCSKIQCFDHHAWDILGSGKGNSVIPGCLVSVEEHGTGGCGTRGRAVPGT